MADRPDPATDLSTALTTTPTTWRVTERLVRVTGSVQASAVHLRIRLLRFCEALRIRKVINTRSAR